MTSDDTFTRTQVAEAARRLAAAQQGRAAEDEDRQAKRDLGRVTRELDSRVRAFQADQAHRDALIKAQTTLADKQAAELEQREREVERDEFWRLHLGQRPWPPSLLREVVDHDHAPEAPVDAAELAAMDLAEYAKHRDRLGVAESNGIHGAELRPWQKRTTQGGK